ncbi:hypothetical protein [Nocardia sp. NRRL S-836]|nr:hypothetical protein [Nocardia sp. NRRL S-836]
MVCEWCAELKQQGELRHATFGDTRACWETRNYQQLEYESELPLIKAGWL